VDEVLAVGDAEFQKKCLGKMRTVAQSGRTVLFVSHDVTSVRGLCTQALLMEHGSVVASGEARDILQAYYQQTAVQPKSNTFNRHAVAIRNIEFANSAGGNPGATLVFNEYYELFVDISSPADIDRTALIVQIRSESGTHVSTICSVEEGIDDISLSGTIRFIIAFDKMPLFPGTYDLRIVISSLNEPRFLLDDGDAFRFSILSNNLPGCTRSYNHSHGFARTASGMKIRSISDFRMERTP
jgi:lipopolysaccharide transport system ATP-binding protein